MPPKRRGAHQKPLAQPIKPCPPDPPKPPPTSKQPPPILTPMPQPPPPPPLPLESDATKVRKEWSKFIDAWYEPQKKKRIEKLQKDILVKYQSLGPPKETQKLREMELFERLDAVAQQLAQPARAEWERRLELAQLREDQWDDMSAEEQQAVLGVFVGFFSDDVEDLDQHDDISPNPPSFEVETITEDPPYKPSPSHPPPLPLAPSRQTIPPTPTRTNFEFVNPTSFFADTMTPPNPSRNLPALPMDHLATLDPSNSARPAEPVSGGVSGMLGFQNWASEVGIVTQQPSSQSSKPSFPSVPASAQSLNARPRATDIMSRQASAASNLSSPLSKTISPQYSPPNPTTKFSPPINSESLPLGKRYIGPVITEEEPDPLDEEVLKSKMANDYQQYKISLRIQMIYQFHAEAADIEIKLFESLLAGQGTKESRARAVQEHETSMMRLREQKEEERKRLCAEEREKRREEMRLHLAQRRSPRNREDPAPKPGPPMPPPDKPLVRQRPGKATHQKENIPLPPLSAAPPARLEPPSVIKKSGNMLSQDEAVANEALFANALAMMNQGKGVPAGLTPGQASLNEAIFSNAAAILTAQGQLENNGKSTLQPPSIVKKSNSSRSQEYDIPHITVSLAEPPAPVPESAQVPPTTAKGKKGKKGQSAVQPVTAKPVTVVDEPEMRAELPPPAPSLWDAATVAAKSAWGAASASISASKPKPSASVEADEPVIPMPAPSRVSTKKAASAAKKGKKVTIIEEPDVDAAPIMSPLPALKTAATKGAWGSVNGKSKTVPPITEESELEPILHPPAVTSAWGKKAAQAAGKPSLKPQLKVSIAEEQESDVEHGPGSAWTNKPKSAWGAPTAAAAIPTASAGAQAGKKAGQPPVEPRRSGMAPTVRVNVVPEPEPEDEESVEMPVDNGAMTAGSAEAEDDHGASGWFNPENMNYWANFMAGQFEAETEAVLSETAEVPEPTGKHVRWTPTVDGETDDDDDDAGSFGALDEALSTDMWMQYAISGADIPSLGNDTPEASHASALESAQGMAGVWEQQGTKKQQQQTAVFGGAAFTGQWPKMENWLSPPARGQNSGSARVF